MRGVRWTSLVRVATEILGLGSMVVLTHLVSPAEFGAVAVVMVANELANGLAGDGYGAPLVQRAEITRPHVEAVALMSAATGLALALLTFCVALVLPAGVFGARVPELLPLVAPMFLISSLTIVPRALLERRLDFATLSRNDITTTVVTTVVSVALAVYGLNADALLLGLLAGGVTSLAMYQRAAPSPLPRWHRAEMREMLAFGVPNAISSLSLVGTRNVDYMIVSAAFGPARTGYYYRAYLLGVEYQNKFSRILVQILFPLYSRAESVAGMRALRARVIRANAAVVFPVLGVFILTAPVVIPFLLGAEWEPAVLPAQILAAGGLAASLNVGTEGMAVAAGAPRRVMRFTFSQFLVYAAIVGICAQWSLVAVCIGVACFRWGVLVASYRVLLARLGVPLTQLVRDAGPAAVGLAAQFAAGLPVLAAADAAGAAPAIAAAVAGIIALGAYVAALQLVFPAVLHDLVRTALRIVRPSRRAGAVSSFPRGAQKPDGAPAVP